MPVLNFLRNLFGFAKPQPISLNENNALEASLNEKNRIRAKKEKDILEKKKAKAQLKRERLDKEFKDQANQYYAEWLEEFQFRLHMGADETDLSYTKDGEVQGVVIINGSSFNIKTKLGVVSRQHAAVRTSITFEGKKSLDYNAAVFAPTTLVGPIQPVHQANKCLNGLKKQANIIHQDRIVSEREERKKKKREKMERNKAKKKEENSFYNPNTLCWEEPRT